MKLAINLFCLLLVYITNIVFEWKLRRKSDTIMVALARTGRSYPIKYAGSTGK